MSDERATTDGSPSREGARRAMSEHRVVIELQAAIDALARAEAAEADAEKWHSAWVNNANKMEAKLEAAEAEIGRLREEVVELAQRFYRLVLERIDPEASSER